MGFWTQRPGQVGREMLRVKYLAEALPAELVPAAVCGPRWATAGASSHSPLAPTLQMCFQSPRHTLGHQLRQSAATISCRLFSVPQDTKQTKQNHRKPRLGCWGSLGGHSRYIRNHNSCSDSGCSSQVSSVVFLSFDCYGYVEPVP